MAQQAACRIKQGKEGRNTGEKKEREGGRGEREEERRKGSRNKNVCTKHTLRHGVCMILARWSGNTDFE